MDGNRLAGLNSPFNIIEVKEAGGLPEVWMRDSQAAPKLLEMKSGNKCNAATNNYVGHKGSSGRQVYIYVVAVAVVLF